jgi:hypothetical protein
MLPPHQRDFERNLLTQFLSDFYAFQFKESSYFSLYYTPIAYERYCRTVEWLCSKGGGQRRRGGTHISTPTGRLWPQFSQPVLIGLFVSFLFLVLLDLGDASVEAEVEAFC